MTRVPLVAALALLVGCGQFAKPQAGKGGLPTTLVEARKGFVTKLSPQQSSPDPVPKPPAGVFDKVLYDAPSGKLAAYITPDSKAANKLPAVVWITGGDCNSIGDVWTSAPPTNDQTAAALRKAGVVLMFPSLRGGNDNPGKKEGFLGEVDDVLAAADFLAKQEYVDPKRIYLGGHSTGGTLVLLVAECSDRFRAVFSFGPADDVAGYGPEFLPFNYRDPKEIAVRSPGVWLADVRTPTFVFEGSIDGNADSLNTMRKASQNANLHFFEVPGTTHFSVLDPVNRLIAAKILKDDGPTCNIAFTDAEVAGSGRK